MSDKVTLEWSGLANLLKKFDAEPKRIQKAAAQAIFKEANQIMAASKPLCPVLNGFLKASGHVQLPEYDGAQVSVTMGYGGVAEAYAVVQHENLDFHHTVGQAKYLEQPFEEAKPGMSDRIAERISEKLTDED